MYTPTTIRAGARVYGTTSDSKIGSAMFAVVRERPSDHEDANPSVYVKPADRWKSGDYNDEEEWAPVLESERPFMYYHLLSEEKAGRCTLINDPEKEDAPTAEEMLEGSL